MEVLNNELSRIVVIYGRSVVVIFLKRILLLSCV